MYTIWSAIKMAYTVWDLLHTHTHTNGPNETRGSFKFLFKMY